MLQFGLCRLREVGVGWGRDYGVVCHVKSRITPPPHTQASRRSTLSERIYSLTQSFEVSQHFIVTTSIPYNRYKKFNYLYDQHHVKV